jgi:hypothetical protein
MARCLFSLALALAFTAGCQGDRLPLYESCGSVDDCDDQADDCFTVAWEAGRDGTMCTAYCAEHADCPGVSACYELVGDPSMRRVCYQRCDSDLDCPSDHQCVNAEMGGGIVDAICLPN